MCRSLKEAPLYQRKKAALGLIALLNHRFSLPLLDKEIAVQ